MRAEGRRGERGATAIEVALLVTVGALVVAGAVRFVGGRSQGSLDAAGTTIHAGTNDAAPSAGGGGNGGGGGGGTGGPSSPPPATTSVPPTTALPPTTLAPTTTTTTAPTTTTTTPPIVATSTLSSPSAYATSTTWYASADLRVTDGDGWPVAGATVTVTVRSKRITRYGSTVWDTTSVQGTVGPNGTVSIETGPWKRSNSNRITEITYEVASVVLPDGGSWDGASAPLTIDAP